MDDSIFFSSARRQTSDDAPSGPINDNRFEELMRASFLEMRARRDRVAAEPRAA